MIFWIFAAATLISAAFAAFDRDIRRAALAVWVAGLGSGAVCMSLGAEALAILQWIVSTLVAISFIFFVAMFGEGKVPPRAPVAPAAFGKTQAIRMAWMAGAVASGAAFLVMIVIGASHLSSPKAATELPAAPLDLAGLGRMLTGSHVLSLELVALTLLFAVVGGGILARPESRAENLVETSNDTALEYGEDGEETP